MADKNQRIHVRNKLRAEVKLSHPQVGDLKLHTRDISESGAYVFAEGSDLPAVGEIVEVQVQGLGGGVPGPVVSMQIVRFDSEGIGLKFLEQDIDP